MNKKITLPDGTKLQAKFLGAGAFARCYLAEDGFVYSFLKMDTREFDFSKEGIALFSTCENSHMPKIESLGEDDEENRVYKSEYYPNKLTTKNKQAWRDYKLLAQIAKESIINDGMHKGYDTNVKIITKARELGLKESILEALESINVALTNYDLTYCFEFRPCNLKVSDDGELILLDVIFNKKALSQKLNKRLHK
jgi:hypothetical protein